jgi:hypothetical protein
VDEIKQTEKLNRLALLRSEQTCQKQTAAFNKNDFNKNV